MGRVVTGMTVSAPVPTCRLDAERTLRDDVTGLRGFN